MHAYRTHKLTCHLSSRAWLTGIARICTLVLGLTLAAHVRAAELSDCGFKPSFLQGADPILSAVRPPAGNTTMMKVTGDLHNGLAQTFTAEDPVLVADVSLSTTRTVVTPTADIRLKSSMFLGNDFFFPANVPIPVIGQVRGSDGNFLLLIMTGTQQILLVDHTSHFCSRSINMMSRPYVWTLGTLSQTDPDAAVRLQLLDSDPVQASVRVIFGGVSAGQMRFEELWVRGGRVLSTTTHTFDQFAASIDIGPFTFEVLKVGAGQVTLRYDIPALAPVDRSRLPAMQARMLPSNAGGLQQPSRGAASLRSEQRGSKEPGRTLEQAWL